MARNHTKKIVFIALLVAQALIISILESLLPAPFGFAPGAKLGLANLITLIALFTLSKKETMLLVALRLLLQTILGGGASTFFYSLGGAVLSTLFMYLTKTLGPKRVSVIGISMVGGFFHNVGQLLVASWIVQTWTILNYLPMMSILGILAGFFVGIAGNFLLQHIKFLQKQYLILEKGDMKWFN